MQCHKCGASVPGNARFCGQCGAKSEPIQAASWLPPGAAEPTGKIIDTPPPSRAEPPREDEPSREASTTANRAGDWMSTLLGGGCALAIIIAPIYFLLSWCSGPSKTPEQLKAEQAESAENQRKGFHCLSGWDGSNRSFVEKVKRQLRDPDSFQMEETRITPVVNGQHIITMEYRARNGFGGMNVAIATGTVDHGSCEATVVSTGE